MKLISMVIFCLFPTLSLAGEKKDLSTYQSLDLKQFDQVNTPGTSSNGINFSVNCKTEDGRELKSTDAGYQTCLSQAANKNKNQGN